MATLNEIVYAEYRRARHRALAGIILMNIVQARAPPDLQIPCIQLYTCILLNTICE